MNTYVILRRGAWASSAELGEAAERSTAVGEQMPDDVRWIRSYVLGEPDGRVGTVCIYQATTPPAPSWRWTRSSPWPTPSSCGPTRWQLPRADRPSPSPAPAAAGRA
jgi:hypothetical protein